MQILVFVNEIYDYLFIFRYSKKQECYFVFIKLITDATHCFSDNVNIKGNSSYRFYRFSWYNRRR